MNLINFLKFGLVAAFCGLLIGCQSSSPPEVHYYRLTSGGASAKSYSVTVSSVQVPSYLKQSGIVLSVSETELRPAIYHRWSEPIEDGIKRVLEARINPLLEEKTVEAKVAVSIDSFNGSLSGSLSLSGSWRATDWEEEGAASLGKRFAIREDLSADGYPALVLAHSRALEKLAQEIAEALLRE